ncbi:hypothetical protein ACQP60_13665 [Isoptericola variabilis]|uniref:hypothetical protein n=1 Tax=Isoptericola variabilis TaxID=139208 RepID=UPI003D228ED5
MRVPAELPASLLALATAQEGLLSAQQCERHDVGRSRRAGWLRAGRWRAVARGVVDTIAVPPERRTVHDVPRTPVPPWVLTDVGAAVRRSGRATAAVHRDRSDSDLLFDHLRRRSAWVGLLAFGPEAIAVGPCALALLGVEGLPPSIRPEVALPRASNRPDREGIGLRQFDDGMTTVIVSDRRTGPWRLAAPEWAIAQAVPELSMEHGLAVLDSALRLEVVDRAGAARAHDHARGRRGIARRHELWEWADPDAASWTESAARWQCIEEGVPPDILQLPVSGRSGRVVGVGDMAWRLDGGEWLVAELDGFEWHEGDVRSERRDRDRDNDFAAAPGIQLRLPCSCARSERSERAQLHGRRQGVSLLSTMDRAEPMAMCMSRYW